MRPTVTVTQGKCVGLKELLPNGKSYYSFRGVPYAEPPIGYLRFQDPKPLKKFPQPTIDCSVERDSAFHQDLQTLEYVGSENCLHLNVYSPKEPDEVQNTPPVAVMVWIHGGGYVAGSGNSDYYSPEYLVQENVVIVTLNYRLGPLGFLCLPEAGVPGNAGLKDQLLALKWIHENISNFGGDANNVTLFGESAGASSVHLHTISKVSRKYFHKAICQSGTALMDWAVQYEAVDKSKKIAKLMGCESDSQMDMLEHLLQIDDLLKLSKNSDLTLTKDELVRCSPMPFRPCIESNLQPNAILTKRPLDLLNNENSIDIPVMLGYNSEEGIFKLLFWYNKFSSFEKNPIKLIPRLLNICPDDPRCFAVAKLIKELYFHGTEIDDSRLDEMCVFQTDYSFTIGAQLTAELHARKQHKSPLYFYRFSVDDELNMFKRMVMHKLNLTELKGCCHSDEIFYLFNQKFVNIERQEGSLSTKIVKQMCLMWTNFAKYGNPTHNNSLPFNWDPVKKISSNDNSFNLDYLEISENSRMCQNPNDERIQFWRKLFQEWNGSFLVPKLV